MSLSRIKGIMTLGLKPSFYLQTEKLHLGLIERLVIPLSYLRQSTIRFSRLRIADLLNGNTLESALSFTPRTNSVLRQVISLAKDAETLSSIFVSNRAYCFLVWSNSWPNVKAQPRRFLASA